MVDEARGEVFTQTHTFERISSGTRFLEKVTYLAVDSAEFGRTWGQMSTGQ